MMGARNVGISYTEASSELAIELYNLITCTLETRLKSVVQVHVRTNNMSIDLDTII